MPRRDEDALSWEGDDDPTLDTRAPVVADEPAESGATLHEGWTPVGRGSESVARSSAPASVAPAASAVETTVEPEPAEVAPPGPDASGPGASTSAPADADAGDAESAPLGNVALVSLGVLGGIYLLYAVGWLVGALRLQGRYTVLVTDVMYQGALWLAAAAPLIWFATVMFATRRARPWARWLGLILGVILLVPWPFLMIGVVGR